MKDVSLMRILTVRVALSLLSFKMYSPKLDLTPLKFNRNQIVHRKAAIDPLQPVKILFDRKKESWGKQSLASL